jgi:hypothetical protein
MHDLMHDLARIILEKKLLVLDISEKMAWNGLEKHYCQHMRLINYQKQLRISKNYQTKLDLYILQRAVECNFNILNPSIYVSWNSGDVPIKLKGNLLQPTYHCHPPFIGCCC